MLREGATDAQIADALRQGFPHFTVPASLHDRCAGKQPEGTGTTEKGTQPAAQKKRTHTRRQATQTQPALLAPDAFAAALGAIPHEDWCRTWAAGRTIMLRRTSKRVKEVVDKMRLPAVVRLSRRFWSDVRNGTAAEKLQFVLRQLTPLTTWCRISTLDLHQCEMNEQDAERLADVLAQCPALSHLDLCGFVEVGRRHGGCYQIGGNQIGSGGAESIAGVLAQCPALAHLDLSHNGIHNAGAERLAGELVQCRELVHLNLSWNQIEEGGAESLAGVLAQCPAAAHLDLSYNPIGYEGAMSFAGVLAQCTTLTHLNLRNTDIGSAGAESFAGVLGQCTALTHLNLCNNGIGAVEKMRLRCSWRGQASGLVL
jgi:Ran GTPase-activating protein (RanGAP) involved in mRNA processing and transport